MTSCHGQCWSPGAANRPHCTHRGLTGWRWLAGRFSNSRTFGMFACCPQSVSFPQTKREHWWFPCVAAAQTRGGGILLLMSDVSFLLCPTRFVFTDTNVLRRPKSVLTRTLLLLVLDCLFLGLRRLHAGYSYQDNWIGFRKMDSCWRRVEHDPAHYIQHS